MNFAYYCGLLVEVVYEGIYWATIQCKERLIIVEVNDLDFNIQSYRRNYASLAG